MVDRYLTLISTLAICLALLVPRVLIAAEIEVEVASGVPGKLSIPETVAAPHAAVLLLHGFNGRMDEVGDLYKDLADELAARGIASLRFDFSGEGERVGYVVTSTFDSRLAETAAAYALLQDRFPEADYGVVGFSLGGLTAMATLADNPDWFDSMVLWSAAAEMRPGGNPLYATAARKAMKEGSAVYQDFTKITLTREFLASFVGVQVGGNVARFNGSLLTIRGTNDFLPTQDVEWLNSSPSSDKAFLMIGGADHIFNVLENPQPNYGERVIEATADWLERTLNDQN